MFWEITAAVSIAGMFFFLSMIAQIVSINISEKKNHKRNLQRLGIEHKNKIDYMKKETFFERKLNRFENFSERSNLLVLETSNCIRLIEDKNTKPEKFKEAFGKVMKDSNALIKEDLIKERLYEGSSLNVGKSILDFSDGHTKIAEEITNYMQATKVEKDDKKAKKIFKKIKKLEEDLVGLRVDITKSMKKELQM